LRTYVEEIMKQLGLSIIVAVGLTLPAFGQAAAAELPKEGKYDFSDCSVATALHGIEFSKTNGASSYEFVGTNRSNPPGGMFDMTSFRCVGLDTTIDAKQSATGVCEVIDKDGDKVLVRYDTDAQGRINESAIAGTGKYEGIISRSTTLRLPKLHWPNQDRSRFVFMRQGRTS
jgi:hypothetical protein